MIEGLKFLWVAWNVYCDARRTGNCQYATVKTFGVPQVCIYVGLGRDAWRIAKLAVEGWEPMK